MAWHTATNVQGAIIYAVGTFSFIYFFTSTTTEKQSAEMLTKVTLEK